MSSIDPRYTHQHTIARSKWVYAPFSWTFRTFDMVPEEGVHDYCSCWGSCPISSYSLGSGVFRYLQPILQAFSLYLFQSYHPNQYNEVPTRVVNGCDLIKVAFTPFISISPAVWPLWQSQHVTTCHNMSQHVTTCHNMSQHVTTCHNMLQLNNRPKCRNAMRLTTPEVRECLKQVLSSSRG